VPGGEERVEDGVGIEFLFLCGGGHTRLA
jgi:hypothetical protein